MEAFRLGATLISCDPNGHRLAHDGPEKPPYREDHIDFDVSLEDWSERIQWALTTTEDLNDSENSSIVDSSDFQVSLHGRDHSSSRTWSLGDADVNPDFGIDASISALPFLNFVDVEPIFEPGLGHSNCFPALPPSDSSLFVSDFLNPDHLDETLHTDHQFPNIPSPEPRPGLGQDAFREHTAMLGIANAQHAMRMAVPAASLHSCQYCSRAFVDALQLRSVLSAAPFYNPNFVSGDICAFTPEQRILHKDAAKRSPPRKTLTDTTKASISLALFYCVKAGKCSGGKTTWYDTPGSV